MKRVTPFILISLALFACKNDQQNIKKNSQVIDAKMSSILKKYDFADALDTSDENYKDKRNIRNCMKYISDQNIKSEGEDDSLIISENTNYININILKYISDNKSMNISNQHEFQDNNENTEKDEDEDEDDDDENNIEAAITLDRVNRILSIEVLIGSMNENKMETYTYTERLTTL
jgi:hypothetical protein